MKDEESAKTIKSKLTIYPNPGTDIFNLSVTGIEGLADIIVWDITGRKVLHLRESLVENQAVQFNLNEYNSGIYFVEVNQDNVKRLVGKLIKKQ